MDVAFFLLQHPFLRAAAAGVWVKAVEAAQGTHRAIQRAPGRVLLLLQAHLQHLLLSPDQQEKRTKNGHTARRIPSRAISALFGLRRVARVQMSFFRLRRRQEKTAQDHGKIR